MNVKSVILTAVSVIAVGPALASNFSGTIQKIRVQKEPANASVTRVSINISGSTTGTGCLNQGWYVVEYSSDGSAGKAQFDGLLAAKNRGAAVSIVGSDVCDPYGVEGVNYIDFL